MPVAVRELKASLSRMLLRAQQGEVIEVTSQCERRREFPLNWAV